MAARQRSTVQEVGGQDEGLSAGGPNQGGRRLEGAREGPGVRSPYRGRVLPRLALAYRAGGDGEVKALAGERQGAGFADTPAGSGHKRHPAGHGL